MLRAYTIKCLDSLLSIINWLVTRGCSRLEPFPSLQDEFPEGALLERHWRDIRKEALHLVSVQCPAAGSLSRNLFGNASLAWKANILKFYNYKHPNFQFNADLCPKTMALLTQLPRVRLAMFSILEPGARIYPHTGLFRGCVRYHLGLSVPQDRNRCELQVNNQIYHWKEGEGILFDDTYVHEVHNRTNERRIVLFCDVQRSLPFLPNLLNGWLCNSVFPGLLFEM